MQKYVCGICGHEYDSAENDNAPFGKLPDDWACPICGVGKSGFSPA
ncbi:rubredoxin [Candidatus Desulfovibrio trichonymphae]|uniref:Rubredoxin n=1 Tax=Candidatus Desulfovibrio trichonymphae TaxID=1725232 RepID=A0A1J1E364_9BACT|nr:rubredoxin [Candidatus Desulfovibrio trichonymphae]BAV91872.1 rubredoxin [Candidatus Desulfovibrio trichonymphae]GHU92050.1 rubredoxin [Deltaproteobacteria bacterium]GHV00886.1 rubredoxin [Deltaproteobacteria bacterium]